MPFLIASWWRAGEGRVDQVADIRMARAPRTGVAVLGHAAQGVDVADVEPGSTPWLNMFPPGWTTSTLPVRSPLPKSVPSIRSAPPSGRTRPRPRPCRGRCAGAARGRSSRGAGRCGGTTRWRRRRMLGVYISDRRRRFRMILRCAVGCITSMTAAPDIGRVVELGAGEALGRILVADLGAGQPGLLLKADAGGVDGDLGHAFLVQAKHDAPLQDRGGL